MGEVASTDSPIWRLIAESAGVRPQQAAVILPVTDEDWRGDFAAALELAEPGDLIFAVVGRGTARAMLGLLSHGVWRHTTSPGLAEVGDVLRRLGVRVEQRYALWPSADQVRVAFPRPSYRVNAWVQRSGVLGGGGRRVWARALARSPLFTPLSRLLTPGVALVGRVLPTGRSLPPDGPNDE